MPILRINTNSKTLHERLRKYGKAKGLSLGKMAERLIELGLKFKLDENEKKLENLTYEETSNPQGNTL